MSESTYCEDCGADIPEGNAFCRSCGAAVVTDVDSPGDEAGTVAGNPSLPEVRGYEIEGLLARGGMGEVFTAVQERLDRPVALKLIAPELGDSVAFQERFEREAKIAAALEHPNILPVYEAGEAGDGRLFISMKLSTGEDLDEHLKASGAIPVDEAWPILEQIGAAIDAAHAAGLVHRDIKPRNVLLEDDESTPGGFRVYLTDFGLARLDSSDSMHTATGEILGTVDYMAPEQVEGGPVDSRVDVYAFGCLAYRVLSGDVPFPRETKRETLVAHVSADPPRLSATVSDIPAPVDAAVAQMLAKNPDERGDSVTEVLRKARTGTPADADTEVLAAPEQENQRRLRFEVAWRLPVFAVLFAAGFIGGSTL